MLYSFAYFLNYFRVHKRLVHLDIGEPEVVYGN
jgi:hypothetical protein